MSLLGPISYATAAFGFAVLTVMLLLHWQRSLRGGLLIVASAVTCAWAVTLTWVAVAPGPVIVMVLAELWRSAGWLAFLLVLLYPAARLHPWLKGLLFATAALIMTGAFGVGLVWLAPPLMEIGAIRGLALFSGQAMAMAVAGVVLLEQLLRNASAPQRSSTKFLCAGLGIFFAYDLYLYSYILLYQQPDSASWQARGIINALAVPLILVSARRNADWQVPVYVSRGVVFHTAGMLLVGGYLLLLALGGYYVRDFGGSWGEFAQVVLMAGGLVVLLLLLSSDSLRRKLRVQISKHFFNRKYDYREQWLTLTDRLAEERGNQTPYQRAVEVVADVVESPSGLIWRDGEQGFELCGSWRMTAPEAAVIPNEEPLVRFLHEVAWIVDLEELRSKPERYQNIDLPRPIREISSAWTIVPLLHQETLTGFIVLTEPMSGTEIKWEDRDLMKTLGKQVASYLGQHENAQALAQARQFEAFNQFTAYLMHDLKNVVAQQSLIAENAEKHKDNPEFVNDAFATITDSVRRMERILDQMQRRQGSQVIERVDVRQLLSEVVTRCSDRQPRPALGELATKGVVETDREELTMVITHLVRNAQDATEPSGMVCVEAVTEQDQYVLISITDDGSGMSESFIQNQLFKPFHTTKSVKGMGIGAHQAKEFARRHNGRLSVSSQIGHGSTFRLKLPTVP